MNLDAILKELLIKNTVESVYTCQTPLLKGIQVRNKLL